MVKLFKQHSAGTNDNLVEQPQNKRLSKEEKIKNLQEKAKQIQAQIAKLQALDKAKERKAQTRQKIIIGGIVLKLVQSDAHLKNILKLELSKLSERDKVLFVNF